MAIRARRQPPTLPPQVHEGAYTELQVGPARTQMHVFPLGAESSLEWTEHFKAWQADTEKMHAADYATPLAEVRAWRESPAGLPDAELAKVDEVLLYITEITSTPYSL